jgi:branched-chain amino acid transport system ATP-binding protein
MLRVIDVVAGYNSAAVVQGVSLDVEPGSVVCLIGANGAGKSTIAKTIAGLVRPSSGSVSVDDTDITRLQPAARVRSGISLVPEDRHLFFGMSVHDNLQLGGFTAASRHRDQRVAKVIEIFPALGQLMNRRAGQLSGGEQQMLAMGRAMMAEPKYIVLDEPSLGLAPMLVNVVMEQCRALAGRGIGVLLIEQSTTKALEVSEKAYVLEHGRFALSGTSADVIGDPRVADAYLGGTR